MYSKIIFVRGGDLGGGGWTANKKQKWHPGGSLKGGQNTKITA